MPVVGQLSASRPQAFFVFLPINNSLMGAVVQEILEYPAVDKGQEGRQSGNSFFFQRFCGDAVQCLRAGERRKLCGASRPVLPISQFCERVAFCGADKGENRRQRRQAAVFFIEGICKPVKQLAAEKWHNRL